MAPVCCETDSGRRCPMASISKRDGFRRISPAKVVVTPAVLSTASPALLPLVVTRVLYLLRLRDGRDSLAGARGSCHAVAKSGSVVHAVEAATLPKVCRADGKPMAARAGAAIRRPILATDLPPRRQISGNSRLLKHRQVSIGAVGDHRRKVAVLRKHFGWIPGLRGLTIHGQNTDGAHHECCRPSHRCWLRKHEVHNDGRRWGRRRTALRSNYQTWPAM